MNHDIDVTKLVSFGANDDENLPLTKCLCGRKLNLWSEGVLGVYREEPWVCEQCREKLYFEVSVKVLKVVEPTT